jgi:hypothetical protein
MINDREEKGQQKQLPFVTDYQLRSVCIQLHNEKRTKQQNRVH